MKLETLALDRQFCEERGITDPNAVLAALALLPSQQWDRLYDLVVDKVASKEWWGTLAAYAGGSREPGVPIRPLRKFDMIDSARIPCERLFDLIGIQKIRLPKGVRISPAACARAALDVWTSETLFAAVGPKQEPQQVEVTQASLFSVADLGGGKQQTDAAADLRNEIRELHAMLRATLSDLETVRRDVGDVRYLVRALTGPKAPGRTA